MDKIIKQTAQNLLKEIEQNNNQIEGDTAENVIAFIQELAQD